ncbi:MAG: Ig-like domain-containing protein, partial [Actinomycetota bacterium]|nr:Ig-like domain-containing protein [Actinomycetota bacterium]
TVDCVDDAPVAVNDTATVLEDASATTINVLTNDTDIDGGPKFIDAKTNSTNGGVVTITNAGADLTYTPAANYCNAPELQPAGGNIVETFTYTLNGTPASVGTVTVTVTCVNDPPTADTETFNGTDSALSNVRLDNGTSTAGLDIEPSAFHNVLTGDVDIEGDPITLIAGADCTGTAPFTCLTDGYDPDGVGGQPVERGTVSLESDGDFHYVPPPGFIGTDSFDYRVSDGEVQNAEANGTVNINVAGPTTWFVDDTAGGGGNGTSARPFQTFAPLTTAGASDHLDDANDTLFVYEGNYTSGIVLENGQKLLGHPHSLDINDTAGRTHTDLVSGAGTAPAISHAFSPVVTLGSGNELQDLALGNGSVSLTGGSVGTATVRDTSIVTTGGKALGIGGGNLDMVFSTFSSTNSPTEAIKLSNVTGSFTANGGVLQNATNAVVDIAGASQDVSFAGNISDSGGEVISIANTTGGTKDFNGTVTGAGSGSIARINLTNNTGSIIRFDNDVSMTVNTLGSPAVNATGGGTLHMGSDDNVLTTTTGTPLKVVNTTIGASDLIFDSISSNGAANGIVLDNTGNTGNLQVTGNPGADTNDGGTIANTTGADAATNQCAKPSGQPSGVGILLKNTNGVILNDMLINGSSNFGLLAHDVNGFTLDDSTFSGTHGTTDAQDEGTAHFCNLTGSATISDSVIHGSVEDGLKVRNVGGTLNRLTVSNTDFATGTGGVADDAFEASSTGGGTFNVTVNAGSAFTTAAGDHLQYSMAGTGTGDLVVDGNAFSNNYANALGGGVTVNPGGNSSNVNVTYSVTGNTFRDSTIPALTVTTGGTLGATGTYSGTISNNQIGVTGIVGSGAKQNSSGISFHHMGNGTHTVSILNNTIKQYSLAGIRLLANGGSPTVRATIKGNTINEPVAGPDLLGGIIVEMGSSVSTATSCIDLGSAAQQNSISNSDPNNAADIVLYPDGSSTMNLPGYVGPANGAGTTAALTSYLTPRNSGDGPPAMVFNDLAPVQYTGSGLNCA